ncbi:OmpH family outer membrane protein [Candidatus Nitronereus thalassa]|uniref:OmpH family outer membrane protein n=1 Tax=Candidatus Nitronereus thalassa TaxID=3020898 RepID=A0ABU3KCL4_9BACT|nr:OmpH family outer membrane protein [Candidatus Nitronereus thalassa]MDT7044012.1 OmpH family outer membrane protein [Candidatus Nitronereus thalassa]
MPRGRELITNIMPQQTAILLLTIFMVGVGFGFPQAFAASDFKVGIVDPQAVIEKSKSGKRALETLKEHATVRQKLLGSDEEELKALQEELQNTKGLSEADTKAKQGLFQRKLQEYQKRGQEFQQELAQKQRSMVSDYMGKIEAATKAVADRHGFSLVIDKGSESTLKIVLYSRNGLDITNEVVKEFDKKFP